MTFDLSCLDEGDQLETMLAERHESAYRAAHPALWPLIDHARCTVLVGDCALLDLPENSVDSLVTDPPAGIAFMGKAWDGARGGREAWSSWLGDRLARAHRALKPGGHGLVWSLPRTQHWTMCALEDIGFEIRDVVYHMFGSGFPKSLNVGKAIDAALGREREKISERPGTRTREMCGEEQGKGFGEVVDVTLPASLEAALAEGWGTALKPAVEPWILVRKPFEGTVAANFLKWGTGAINIDASRIGSGGGDGDGFGASWSEGSGLSKTYERGPDVGRWPAHVVLTCECGVGQDSDGEIVVHLADCPVRILDEQSGATGQRGDLTGSEPSAPSTGVVYALRKRVASTARKDKGGASRFFYVAKPAARETELGLEHLAPRTGGEATDREDDSAGLNSPRAGAGRRGGKRNIHPTKKSVALMTYLIRMVTPGGGIVLDPFAGSGTTGVAALAAGFRAVLVEQGGEPDPTWAPEFGSARGEYLPIIGGRIARALGIPAPRPA